MKKKILLVATITFWAISFTLLASSQVGIIVKKQGDVKVYTNPGKKISGPKPHILFEGTYYSVKEARLGYKIKNGNIVVTGNKSKARIVFKNGDQYNIGEGTAYKTKWSKKNRKGKANSIIGLMRGKFRAVVSKKGPRNRLSVQTRNASMGVRGTDFFVTKKGNSGNTKVSVIRGEVEIKTKPKKITKSAKNVAEKAPAPKPQEMKLQSGFSAKIEERISTDSKKDDTKTTVAEKKEVVQPVILLEKTHKRELATIQKTSVIKLTESEKTKQEEEINNNQGLAKEVKKLEIKAIKTTLEDIKEYDPELYKKVKEIKSIAKLNTQVIKKVFENAPEAPAKPDLNDIDDIDDNAYDKYFEIE